MNDQLTMIIYAVPIIIAIFVFIKRRALAANPSVSNVTAQQVQELLDQKSLKFILDVRTPHEYAAGHLPGAINVPLQQLTARLNDLKKHSDQPVLVYCESGGRSPKAVGQLLNNGFTDIRHYNKGYSTWRGKTTNSKKR